MKVVVTQLGVWGCGPPLFFSVRLAKQKRPYWAWYFSTPMFNVSMQTVCVLYFVSDWVVEELSPAALLVSVPEGEAAVFLTTQALLYKVNRPAQVEVALPFFHLRQLDFAWLMNCDKTQLQGCLCCSLCVFFFIYLHQTRWCGKQCQRELMCLNLGISRLGWISDTVQWAPEGSSLSHCKSCWSYSQLLLFQYCTQRIHNVTNLPWHDKPCTTSDQFLPL